MQKANFLPQIVFETLKFKKCDWSRAFSMATQELDFSQPCDILQIPKGNYAVSFKTKKSHWWTNCFSQNLYWIFISEHFGHAWLNAKKITWSNCNFHENLTTIEKGTLYLKQLFWYQNLKNLAIWWAESIFVYNLRKWFTQNMQILYNHKGKHGASFKHKNSTLME